MKIIVCLDDRDGMCFNHRRQSKDRAVIADIRNLIGDAPLWVNAYSAPLFEGVPSLHVAENFLHQAPESAWCFVEDQALLSVAERIDTLVVYRWNRHYPADLHLDLSLKEWQQIGYKDFAGHSHEKLTREEYKR